MKKIRQTEPVPMDVHLLLHETMVNNMSKSLAHTKKRLFDAELTLNLRPADNDPNEIQVWEGKVNRLLNTHDNLPFPTLYHFKREYEESHLSIDAKKSEVSADWQNRMNENLNKQIKQLQARVLHNVERHESDEPGSVIRVIENYQGCNSHIRDGKRVLVRKESKGWVDTSSSLPPWFGPNYYPEATKYNPNAKNDNAFQLAFKATSRSGGSSERRRRAEIDRRRNEINTIKRELKSQQKSRGKGVAFYLTECESPPGSAFRAPTGHSEDFGLPPRSAGLSASVSLESSTKSKAPILFDFNEDGESQSSLPFPDDDASSAHSAGSQSESSLSFFAKELKERRQRESRGQKKHAQLLKSYTHQSLFSNTAESKTPTRRRRHLPPVALNPIYDHNPFAVKMLNIDVGNRSKPQKFQVKDYTRDAFALQPPQTRFIDYNYDEEVAEIEEEMLRSAPGTPAAAPTAAAATSKSEAQSPPTEAAKKSRMSLKYSSDIFRVPNVGYMAPYKPPTTASPERKSPSPTQAGAKNEEKDNEKEEPQANLTFSPNASRTERPMSPHQPMASLTADIMASPPPTAATAAVSSSSSAVPASAGSSPVLSRINTANVRSSDSQPDSLPSLGGEERFAEQFNETGEVSPQLSPFRNSEIYQHHKLRRAPSKISAIEKKPGFRDVYIAQILGKPIPTAKSNPTSPKAMAYSGPATSTGPVQHSLELRDGVDLEDSIQEWYEKNDVSVPTKKMTKRLQQKDTFLSHHRALPTIELSLSGLLLEENPYTKNDPIIQKNLHKNTEDMKM